MPTSPETLISLVENFGHPRIMLVGDVMVDEYIYGDAERLSPEAPVPVVQERYREQRAGGAGNVASGLATLGAEVLMVSVCGNDFQGRLLLELFQKMSAGGTSEGGVGEGGGVITDGILRSASRPTTSKTRVVGLAQHRHPQQMLRLDQETTAGVTPEQETQLLAYVEKNLPRCEAVALEDYNKGLLTASFCQKIISLARGFKKPVLVDPALLADYSKYDGASTITPNRFEAEKAAGLHLGDSPEGAGQLARALREKHHLETCLLTLDRHGMYFLDEHTGTVIPTRPRNVYDVTGAGDMVLATLAMAIACGATWLQAAHLANIAGGLEVEKFGIVPIRRAEIIDELYRQDSASHAKVKMLPQLLKEIERGKKSRAGQTSGAPGGGGVEDVARGETRIVFTNGVFDILHGGHVKYLDFAKEQGDVLVVGVNSDDSVRRLKGPSRPVNPLEDRMAVLAGLASVDYVISFEEDTPASLIGAILPDVLVKGEDYAGKEVVGREIVEKHGGRVILAPLLAGRSTTGTIQRASQ